MNISTGGPHILLFERDQQLTALIISEFQLAGYECHTARTAVEVFDALARYPVRIVLVDLAQAAAARREFWVALDTQRRGRGIQVLTFHCSNIAGYGPRDPEERSQNTAADLDIDGMLGLMKLVDEVRNRVPGVSSTTNTIPRVPRVAPTPQPTQTAQRTGSLAPVTMNNGAMNNNGNSFRNGSMAENTANPVLPRNTSSISSQSTLNTPIAPTPTGRSGFNTTPPAANGTSGTKMVSYTDKIRAVLYPNQRSWSTQGSTPTQTPQADIMRDGSQPAQGGLGNSTVLQRLANGQTGSEESGLAQLSRLAQANYMTTSPGQYETSRDNNQQQVNAQPMMEARFTQSAITAEQAFVNTGAVDYAPTTSPEQNIGAQPLRASPIQDIPIERAGGNQADGGRRPDVLTRSNHGQQQVSAALSPLASITTPPSVPIIQASGTMSASSTSSTQTAQISSAYPSGPLKQGEESANNQLPEQTVEKPDDNGLEDISAVFVEPSEIEQQNEKDQGQTGDEADVAQNRNTMLFDIMQSLPPMPPIGPQSQTIQAQVLNGRATRSLGSVLLAGHLVPQNRLEVAQNIQRMLRGVDLNYQLGEILLMFKLLTPDQLLAASLVSYGMITTVQVSALGRIRQELHSIGLEYDLESLLILFRILTPEQLREAKSGMQG
jgi:hypothetical protein